MEKSIYWFLKSKWKPPKCIFLSHIWKTFLVMGFLLIPTTLAWILKDILGWLHKWKMEKLCRTSLNSGKRFSHFHFFMENKPLFTLMMVGSVCLWFSLEMTTNLVRPNKILVLTISVQKFWYVHSFKKNFCLGWDFLHIYRCTLYHSESFLPTNLSNALISFCFYWMSVHTFGHSSTLSLLLLLNQLV